MKPFMERIDSVSSVLADIIIVRGRRLRQKDKGRLNFILLISESLLSMYEKGGLKLWDLEILRGFKSRKLLGFSWCIMAPRNERWSWVMEEEKRASLVTEEVAMYYQFEVNLSVKESMPSLEDEVRAMRY
jgi:hypothetical protein